MSEQAKQFRAAMRAKAERMGSATSAGKVDCSDYGPVEQDHLNADVKTGLRPISKRQFQRGGAVIGSAARAHGGRAARKDREGKQLAADFSNVDNKAANTDREGVKHIGGMKKGGRSKKDVGGAMGGGPLGGISAVTSPQEAMGAAQAAQNAGGVGPQRMAFGPSRPGLLHVKKGGSVKGRAGGGLLPPPTDGPPPIPQDDGGDAEKMALMEALLKAHKKSKKHKLPPPPDAAMGEEPEMPPRGVKRGGKARADGGKVDPDEAEDNADQEEQKKRAEGGGVYAPNVKLGPREGLASGGKAKGRTNINIIIGAHAPGGEQQQPPGGGPPPPRPIPVPPPPMPGGMPPGGPPPGAPPPMGPPPGGPPGMPPPGMPRAAGGRAYPIKHAAGGGKGRLEKIRSYGEKP